MTLTPQQIESLCAYADEQRAEGRSWDEIGERLLAFGGRNPLPERVVKELPGWHAAWKKKQLRDEQGREDTPVEPSSFEAMAAGEVCAGGESGEVLHALKYLGRNLVKQKPVWSREKIYTLRGGEVAQYRQGEGVEAGAEWLVCAVVIVGPGGVRRVFPEHRIVGMRAPGWNNTRGETVRMRELTLGLVRRTVTLRGGETAAEEKKGVVVFSGEQAVREFPGMKIKGRKHLKDGRERLTLERPAERLDTEGILTRFAGVMELYGSASGLRNAAHVAALTGRTRAAAAAQRAGLVAEYYGQTDGEAGFAGVKSAARLRARAKERAKYARATNNVMHCPGCDSCGTLNATARPRVFCASLADWLDEEVPVEWLADLLALIFETPNLDWLLLTKRPENFFARLNAAWRSRVAEDVPWSHRMVSWGERGIAPSNVWIGTTVENQEYAERRIPELLKIPAAVRFLSVEPMLGPVDLLSLEAPRAGRSPALRRHVLTQIDWVICGGESGPGRRPFEVEWAESLAAQCRTAGVPFFMKQDGHARSGQQGRIPSALWARKEWPVSISISPGEPAARRGAGAPDAGAPDLKDQNQRATEIFPAEPVPPEERGPCGSAPGGIEHEAAKGTKPEGGAE